MIMFGSVHQKRVEIKEGQLAEKPFVQIKYREYLRNRTKKKLAAEGHTRIYLSRRYGICPT